MSNSLVKALTTKYTEQDVVSFVVYVNNHYKQGTFDLNKSLNLLNSFIHVLNYKHPSMKSKEIIIHTLNKIESKLVKEFNENNNKK